MEGEPDLPAPAAEEKFFKPNPSHPININPDSIYLSRSFTTCTSTASSSPRTWSGSFKQPLSDIVP
ncbi:UNVERIFIED_CONTAM: hypothetical protein Sradi_5192700 [Sesamum radiatum]|uniref:Uncharacterized protein n=1 Tax=Sesamum radiatum TaxID=300843 RepID=A0AAW2M434_SESRA